MHYLTAHVYHAMQRGEAEGFQNKSNPRSMLGQGKVKVSKLKFLAVHIMYLQKLAQLRRWELRSKSRLQRDATPAANAVGPDLRPCFLHRPHG